MKDRSYYRLETNEALIDDGKYNPSIELCIVLAERLEQAEWDVREAAHLRNS